MKPETNGNDKTLNHVRQLLEAGKAAEARAYLLHITSRPPELQNAMGVCLLRLGEATQAIDLYRTLVLTDGGVCFRPDAKPAVLANFATALLLSGNVAGCEAALEVIGSRNGPVVGKLREAISRWKKSLGVFRRWMVALNGTPYEAKVSVDFPPGEL